MGSSSRRAQRRACAALCCYHTAFIPLAACGVLLLLRSQASGVPWLFVAIPAAIGVIQQTSAMAWLQGFTAPVPAAVSCTMGTIGTLVGLLVGALVLVAGAWADEPSLGLALAFLIPVLTVLSIASIRAGIRVIARCARLGQPPIRAATAITLGVLAARDWPHWQIIAYRAAHIVTSDILPLTLAASAVMWLLRAHGTVELHWVSIAATAGSGAALATAADALDAWLGLDMLPGSTRCARATRACLDIVATGSSIALAVLLALTADGTPVPPLALAAAVWLGALALAGASVAALWRARQRRIATAKVAPMAVALGAAQVARPREPYTGMAKHEPAAAASADVPSEFSPGPTYPNPHTITHMHA